MNRKRVSHIFYRALPGVVVVCTGVLLFVLRINFKGIAQSIQQFSGILTPFFAAFAIAYVLSTPLNYLERKWLKGIRSPRLRRLVAALLVYTMALLIVAAFIAVVLPQVVLSVRTLLEYIPGWYKQLESLVRTTLAEHSFDPAKVTDLFASWEVYLVQALDIAKQTLPKLLDFSLSIGSFVLNILVALVASIYLLFNKERFCSQAKRLLYATVRRSTADKTISVVDLSHRTFGGFLSGKLIDSLIIGIICFVGCSLMKMPFALLVSVVIGVTNIIPFFGPIIGAVPAAFIILIAEPIKALWFVLFVIALQQFDGNFLGPKILGQSTGLSAFWVMFSILIAGHFLGVLGMVVGVPMFSVIYVLTKSLVEERLKKRGMPTDAETYKAAGPVAPVEEDVPVRPPVAETFER